MRVFKYDCALLVDNNATDNYVNKVNIVASKLAKNVLVKTNGKEAIDYLNSCLEVPDIIFFDINIPIAEGVVFLHDLEALPSLERNASKIVVLAPTDMQEVLYKMLGAHEIYEVCEKPLTKVVCEQFASRSIVSI